MAVRLWARNELVEVLKLYCRTPFGRLHSRNPDIVAVAEKIGRTPGAVALKAVNFASLDPTIAQKGMSNASALDREVWQDFFANMDSYLADEDTNDGQKGFEENAQAEYVLDSPVGEDIRVQAKARRNQSFFREMILASYEGRCALSGISASELLVASHIVPWSADPALRTNPRNGICINALHDKAFDRGLISFADDLTVLYSSRLPRHTEARLRLFSSDKLARPSRFGPDPSFLSFHRDNLFRP
jgi:putative restriction endonuclease